ncbi:hypothetical protein GA0115240_129417 [Streptomyces sp. DvalAA-14]|uniref:hypothetical protein n=1 Tax=unclassified Streptomyces TaxID=2593676 RepID=UPI00081B1157|nr:MULTISPECIES: hypothetical protein [unclassified Streptomyces]MYS21380.1 hypothetical protein [Streptomyces sp. SID4948]SCD91048.1 hypothetical protein GA0115240_129417 [Streptomyces sp. DvalAA-14]
MKIRRVGSVVTAAAALALLPQTAFATTWNRLPGYSTWTGATALERGQGIATDGTYFYYSGTYSLDKATVSGNHETAANALAIPAALSGGYGSDHIGDIDVYGGYVVAPIEDGDSYQNPILALYSTADLSWTGRYVRLPLALLPGGVPWVAVDPAAGLVWTAAWNQDAAQGTDELVGYRLGDLLSLPAGAALPVAATVRLSSPLSRIQGAAMLNGTLYASVDGDGDGDGDKAVYAIDPATGAVSRAFSQDVQPDDEVEGIAALDLGPAGGQLHILNVGSGWKSIFLYLQHYQPAG